MHLPSQSFLNGLTFNYVDIIVLGWLIIGFFRGRKLGMSQELLPLLKWLTTVVVAGQYYRMFSPLVRSNCGFEPLWSNITAYLLIVIVLGVIFSLIKKAFGEKLVGSDLFGTSEYYLGMISGPIRFACMLFVLVAIMNSFIYSEAQLAKDRKMQKEAFESISFPTYGSIQHEVLFESFSGKFIKSHLANLLITPVATTSPLKDQLKKNQQAIDEIIGPSGK